MLVRQAAFLEFGDAYVVEHRSEKIVEALGLSSAFHLFLLFLYRSPLSVLSGVTESSRLVGG